MKNLKNIQNSAAHIALNMLISQMRDIQIGLGISRYQLARNSSRLEDLVLAFAPDSIKDGMTQSMMEDAFKAHNLSVCPVYLASTLSRLVREEKLRVAPGPKNGKRGRNPRKYALV